ncbi:MAG: hypothetical protein Q8R92_16955 [Deltaproteobacteria bacterium]|nr:hypothetical protein [Deltaproteobacteria bacterium]
MRIIRLRSTIARPAVATAYTAGDEISNNASAGSVVRATFNLAGFRRGRIFAAMLDFTAASGNVVTTNADLELLIFKTGDVPAAVGDNVTHPIAAATRALAVGGFRFDDTGWTGPLGTVAAGASQVQAVGAHVVQPLATNVLQYPWPQGFAFEFLDDDTRTFTAVLRALAAWDPTGIVNTFGITIDIEAGQ